MTNVDNSMALSDGVLTRGARLARAYGALVFASAVGTILLLGEAGDFLPLCLFHELTGVSCLTCGLTRSLEAAFHGHLVAALQFHLLGPFILAGLLVGCLICAAETLTGKRIAKSLNRRTQQYTLLGGGAIWIAYGVVRAIVELL